MNLFLVELKGNLRYFLVWIVVAILSIIFLYLIFPRLTSEGLSIPCITPSNTTCTEFPALCGEYFRVLGMFLTSLFAVVLASRLIALEESRGTAEFLMVRPVSRVVIFLQKYTAFLLILLLFHLVLLLITVIITQAFSPVDIPLSLFLTLIFNSLLLSCTTGSIALFITMVLPKRKSSLPIVVATLILLYIINLFSHGETTAPVFSYLSPFSLVNTNVGASDYHLAGGKIFYFIGTTLFFTGLSLAVFTRKDIQQPWHHK